MNKIINIKEIDVEEFKRKMQFENFYKISHGIPFIALKLLLDKNNINNVEVKMEIIEGSFEPRYLFYENQKLVNFHLNASWITDIISMVYTGKDKLSEYDNVVKEFTTIFQNELLPLLNVS